MMPAKAEDSSKCENSKPTIAIAISKPRPMLERTSTRRGTKEWPESKNRMPYLPQGYTGRLKTAFHQDLRQIEPAAPLSGLTTADQTGRSIAMSSFSRRNTAESVIDHIETIFIFAS